MVCPPQMVDWSPLPLRCCWYIPVGVGRSRYFVDMGSLKGTQRDCEVVCVWQSRSSGPPWLPPRTCEGWLDGGGVRSGGIPLCICVVAVIGLCDRRVGTAWRHTPVIHDDPDLRPNRRSFTLTGPSPIFRCWFGKGTPLIAAKPLSWVSPCLTSCCHCRGA